MKMSENNDYIQLPPLKKDTPADVVAFMWEYMKVPEDSREKVKNLLKDAISSFGTTSYSVVPYDLFLLHFHLGCIPVFAECYSVSDPVCRSFRRYCTGYDKRTYY